MGAAKLSAQSSNALAGLPARSPMRSGIALLALALLVSGCTAPLAGPRDDAPSSSGGAAPALPGGAAYHLGPTGEGAGEDEAFPAAAGWTPPLRLGRGIEPSLIFQSASTWFAAAPLGLLTAGEQQRLWRTTDAGATWAQLPPGIAAQRSTAFGGGDADLAVDAAGKLYLSGLWLGSASVASSDDNGQTWQPGNPAGLPPGEDRQWLVATAADTVYLSGAQPGVGYWVAKSTDGGLTFVPKLASPHLTRGLIGTEPSGNLASDRNDADFVVGTATGHGGTIGQGPTVFLTRDAGATWEEQLITTDASARGAIFPSVSVDAAGNVFAVYARTEGGGARSLWLAVGWDHATTWSAPIRLTEAGTTNIFPWVEAGKEGEAVVAFYTAFAAQDPTSSNLDWFLRAARVQVAPDGTATMTVGLADPTMVYHGGVALGTSTSKPLGDFLTVRLQPDGKAVIAYNRFSGGTDTFVVREV